jgi:hypothetical protein
MIFEMRLQALHVFTARHQDCIARKAFAVARCHTDIGTPSSAETSVMKNLQYDDIMSPVILAVGLSVHCCNRSWMHIARH